MVFFKGYHLIKSEIWGISVGPVFRSQHLLAMGLGSTLLGN